MKETPEIKKFIKELEKMLVHASKVTGVQERNAKKHRDYYEALRHKEHIGTIGWLLNELNEYKTYGRWL